MKRRFFRGFKVRIPRKLKKAAKGGILITIQTTDGLFVKKGGLDYAGMKDLVSRLEGLC